MDARITKSRLSNLLSYDWLKIILAIAAAVFAICVFFTTVQTRPRENQVFTVYGYRELNAASGAADLMEKLLKEGVFSYDILDAQQETFGTGQYAETAFAARRSAGQGTVMFTTTNRTDADDPSKTVISEFLGGEMHGLALDLDVYIADCENYLIRFFGEKWRQGELDRAEAEECFFRRNEKDRRYRSEEKKQAGILQEYARLEKLREDYSYILTKIGDGTLSFVSVNDENGTSRVKAFALGKLAGLRDFYYYSEETDGVTVTTAANVCMFVLSNDRDAGRNAYAVENDLRYETFSFLRALIERFGVLS